MQTLILNDAEVREILSDEEMVLSAVEGAFGLAGRGQVQMPPKSYLTFAEYAGDLRTMPAYLPSLEAAGVKVVNSHTKNASAGLPTVMAVIILNDPVSGFPLAILSATSLTARRTGAAGALAAKYLALPNAASAGFVGAGTQAKHQFQFLKRVRPITSVRVYDVDKSRAAHFIELVQSAGVSDARMVATSKEAVEAEIVVTTTPGRGPVCAPQAFRHGTHVNAIGADAPGKQELPPEILMRAKVVVDHREQAIHSGEVNLPISRGLYRAEKIYAELGEIVAGLKPGRESEKEITIFDSTGLAIQDMAVAKRVYDIAEDRRMGKKVDLVIA